ncbi:MAG: ACT domain-containing protein [Clostridiales bacterium]|jgi:hypothetical protein|nr:ACT domain-containing protein [Clostridiales bacterium]
MVNQIAVFMENRKGRILELTKALKEAGLDLITLSIADTKDFGILRCIARDNDLAEKTLKSAGFTVTVNALIGVEVEDRPGGLSDALSLLEDGDINVEYLYSFAHAATKRAVIMFKVSDEAKAVEVLKRHNIRILDNADL